MTNPTPTIRPIPRRVTKRFDVTVVLDERGLPINYAAAIKDFILFSGCVADTEDIQDVVVTER